MIETYDTRADKWIVVDFEEGEENGKLPDWGIAGKWIVVDFEEREENGKLPNWGIDGK